MLTLSDILQRTKDKSENIVNVYLYGSRVYQTHTDKSDYDFIFIVLNGTKTREQFSDSLINVNYYTLFEHHKRLVNHEISALELYFLEDTKYILKEDMKFSFKQDNECLRRSLSTKSSNSFVKAKKKLTIEKDYDYNVGVKSLFHSFRIIYFGIQIAKYGKIVDYSEANSLLFEMKKLYNWSDMFTIYKKEYNKLLTEFRRLCPLTQHQKL